MFTRHDGACSCKEPVARALLPSSLETTQRWGGPATRGSLTGQLLRISENLMNSFAQQRLIAALLAAVVALAGWMPAAGACGSKVSRCRAKQCDCGCCCSNPATTLRACCGRKKEVRPCCCSTGSHEPAAPEPRSSNGEQNDVRPAATTSAARAEFEDDRSMPSAERARLLAPPPGRPLQTILCRWLA